MKKLSCKGCNAKCCQYVATDIDKPKTKKDYEEILWYLLHKKISVYIAKGKWYIEFYTPCKKLDKNHRCRIYEKRPSLCEKHKIDTCEKHGEGDPYDILFKNSDEFIKYLKKKKIKIKGWTY